MVVQQIGTHEPAVAGRSLQLECLWSQGSGPPLYGVQWCKDGDMFFRVILVPEHRKVAFPAPGVQVVVRLTAFFISLCVCTDNDIH